MTAPESAAPEARKKRTVWLLAGGAASLLIPLGGAVYMHVRENVGAPPPSGRSDLFERREGTDQKITPSQTVVPPSALSPLPRGAVSGAAEKPASSSLDFIKTNEELKSRLADSRAAAAAVAAPPPAAAPAASAPAVAASTATAKAAKPGKKPFSMPKLQPSRGFTSNFGPGRSKGQSQDPSGGGQGGSQDILKNLPPGAENNPALQQYLKSQQNH